MNNNKKPYQIVENNGVKFIRFNHIGHTGLFAHGVSTKSGGVSPPPFGPMNLSFTFGDEEKKNENRRLFLKALGYENLEIKYLIKLIHGKDVVKYEDIKKGVELPLEADGILTGERLIPLATTFADCVPVILADPARHASGVLHAGWRGTFKKIAAEGVNKMVEFFGSSPDDILAGIGPGIGPCCFEVGPEAADAFISKFPSWKDLMRESSNKEDKWFIDILNLNKRILETAGLNPKNISIADLCTACESELLHSYRRDGKNSGRMAAVIINR